MNVFIFQNRFEPLIVAGRKVHTIRAPRKDGKPRATVHEAISLRVWVGKPYGSNQREFARAVVVAVWRVRLTGCGIWRIKPHFTERGYHYHDEFVKLGHREIALGDGFKSWTEMRDWFIAQHGLPFEGVLVEWRLV
jgi:hypothetical protein